MNIAVDAIPARTEFDGWRSMGLALYMALVGYSVMVGIPVISTAWVEMLGFTEEQVGRVGGADLGGLALGSVIASVVMARWNRRLLTAVGVAVTVIANLACMKYTSYEATLWLRLLAGTGAGVYTAVAIATLGASSRPARAFNLMLFAFAFSQAAEMQVLPMLSMNGIYWVFVGTFSLTLVFLGWMPTRPPPRLAAADASEQQLARERVPAYLPWLCLAAIFFTYVNIGTYWVYIELASLDAGIDAEWVGRLLVIVSLGSFVGCLVATVISNRWGLARPLLLTLSVMTFIVGLLGFGIDYPQLLLSLAMFNFLWVFIDVYQMATVAVIDRRGTYASLMPGAQGLGQIVGPNIAASMLGWGMGYGPVFILCAGSAFIGMLIYALMYLWLKRDVPLLAEAS